MDAYDALAPVYDAWQERYGAFFALVAARLEPMLEAELRQPGASFVDIGCGTGSLLLRLRQGHSGWRLCGLDASAAMLREARAKCGAETIAWVEAAMGAGVPGGPYDAAGSFFDTLNHLPCTTALEHALREIGAALRPGGLLVFDVNNRLGFERWWCGVRVYEGPGWRLEMEGSFDGGRTARGRARVTRWGETAGGEMQEQCFTDEEIRSALDGAGLVELASEPWRPFEADEPGKTWWVARRA